MARWSRKWIDGLDFACSNEGVVTVYHGEDQTELGFSLSSGFTGPPSHLHLWSLVRNHVLKDKILWSGGLGWKAFQVQHTGRSLGGRNRSERIIYSFWLDHTLILQGERNWWIGWLPIQMYGCSKYARMDGEFNLCISLMFCPFFSTITLLSSSLILFELPCVFVWFLFCFLHWKQTKVDFY